MGLAGGSRCFNRVPRALLVILVWSTAEDKPPGPMSDHFWTKDVLFVCYIYVMLGLVLIGFIGFQIAGCSWEVPDQTNDDF